MALHLSWQNYSYGNTLPPRPPPPPPQPPQQWAAYEEGVTITAGGPAVLAIPARAMEGGDRATIAPNMNAVLSTSSMIEAWANSTPVPPAVMMAAAPVTTATPVITVPSTADPRASAIMVSTSLPVASTELPAEEVAGNSDTQSSCPSDDNDSDGDDSFSSSAHDDNGAGSSSEEGSISDDEEGQISDTAPPITLIPSTTGIPESASTGPPSAAAGGSDSGRRSAFTVIRPATHHKAQRLAADRSSSPGYEVGPHASAGGPRVLPIPKLLTVASAAHDTDERTFDRIRGSTERGSSTPPRNSASLEPIVPSTSRAAIPPSPCALTASSTEFALAGGAQPPAGISSSASTGSQLQQQENIATAAVIPQQQFQPYYQQQQTMGSLSIHGGLSNRPYSLTSSEQLQSDMRVTMPSTNGAVPSTTSTVMQLQPSAPIQQSPSAPLTSQMPQQNDQAEFLLNQQQQQPMFLMMQLGPNGTQQLVPVMMPQNGYFIMPGQGGPQTGQLMMAVGQPPHAGMAQHAPVVAVAYTPSQQVAQPATSATAPSLPQNFLQLPNGSQFPQQQPHNHQGQLLPGYSPRNLTAVNPQQAQSYVAPQQQMPQVAVSPSPTHSTMPWSPNTNSNFMPSRISNQSTNGQPQQLMAFGTGNNHAQPGTSKLPPPPPPSDSVAIHGPIVLEGPSPIHCQQSSAARASARLTPFNYWQHQQQAHNIFPGMSRPPLVLPATTPFYQQAGTPGLYGTNQHTNPPLPADSTSMLSSPPSSCASTILGNGNSAGHGGYTSTVPSPTTIDSASRKRRARDGDGSVRHSQQQTPPPLVPMAQRASQQSVLQISQQQAASTPPPPPPPPPPPLTSGSTVHSIAKSGGPSGSHGNSGHTSQGSDFYCEVCEIDLRNRESYEIHVTEDHVPCDEHIGCNWTGPPALLLAHKYQHNTVGVDSKAEDEAWVAARKRRKLEKRMGISSSSSSDPSQMSVLESFLRANMRGGNGGSHGGVSSAGSNLAIDRRRRLAVMPKLNFYANVFENRRAEAMGPKQPSKQQQNGKRPCRLWQEFNICESYLRTRRCKYGSQCHWSHDIKRYQEWVLNRLRTGIQVRSHASNASALVYMLHYKEICQYEDTVLACLRALARHRFDLSKVAGEMPAQGAKNDDSFAQAIEVESDSRATFGSGHLGVVEASATVAGDTETTKGAAKGAAGGSLDTSIRDGTNASGPPEIIDVEGKEESDLSSSMSSSSSSDEE